MSQTISSSAASSEKAPSSGSTKDYLLAEQIWSALGAPAAALSSLKFTNAGELPSYFAVSDLAAASVGGAGLAMAELIAAGGAAMPEVAIDRRLASFWFSSSLRPQGWKAPALWDAVAGDYPTSDGWIRLHTNAQHHRVAALKVLHAASDRQSVADAVIKWRKDELEAAIVDAKGCAAAMRTQEQWAQHPQGRAIAAEPLVHLSRFDGAAPLVLKSPQRPLQGIRVLDLTRVLAGPTATRFLAAFGADVLRIDPSSWDEPGVVPEMTLGKRCSHLDLRSADGRARLEQLLSQADVLIHGYRPHALELLGLGADRRRAINPGLVDVSLDAYGWSGPWQGRRGFDSLVQMSSGIADTGMRLAGSDRPKPLPVQALDHATGYLMAAAAIRGLRLRLREGAGTLARLSLARTASLLTALGSRSEEGAAFAPETPSDLNPAPEATAWGPAQRLQGPACIAGVAMQWDRPASKLGSAGADW
ncbi:CoA transferase [Herbaspirillum lusitanum]|uniref:CoA transferase n=1 Tax=Herbaspirillum lusitanum TaxID=213312 RepID=A0ABW9AE50_9BURK